MNNEGWEVIALPPNNVAVGVCATVHSGGVYSVHTHVSVSGTVHVDYSV